MAQKRMFSKSITGSSRFLMMPQSSQNLYFHLGMNADDDGFCEIFTVMRITDSKPDDLKVLEAKHFVKIFDDKVLIITDWKENNYIRNDRYNPSKYLKIYETDLINTIGIPNANQEETEVRLDQTRLGNEGEAHMSYLKNIPAKDLEEFIKKFSCNENELKTKAESLLEYCESKNKKYKNYKAFLSRVLIDDFGKRIPKKIPIIDTEGNVAKLVGYKDS